MGPIERAPNIRMIALASSVALAVALPLAAATAGPAAPQPRPRPAPGDGEARARTEAAESDAAAPEAGEAVRGTQQAVDGAVARGGDAGHGLLGGLGVGRLTGAHASADAPASACGPELTAPQGIVAQTCVVAEDGHTWAVTYYRNTSGAPSRAVLTLMRPDGRTVQVHCEVSAADEPEECRTPHDPTVLVGGRPAGVDAYGAVAEFSDTAGEKLLLRSGSAPTGE